MKALIGIAFRMSSSNMVFVSDVFNNLGYLVPKNTTLVTTTSLIRYSTASRRLGFSDYVEEIYLPYFSKTTGTSHDDLIAQSSLISIKDYLQQSDKIGFIHNENDPILMEGEIDTIKSLFPGRAMVYPYGGHCGNMEYRDYVAYMVDIDWLTLCPRSGCFFCFERFGYRKNDEELISSHKLIFLCF